MSSAYTRLDHPPPTVHYYYYYYYYNYNRKMGQSFLVYARLLVRLVIVDHLGDVDLIGLDGLR